MTSVSAGHIILAPTQPVGSGRPQRESNSGPPHLESRALPTELRRPPRTRMFNLKEQKKKKNMEKLIIMISEYIEVYTIHFIEHTIRLQGILRSRNLTQISSACISNNKYQLSVVSLSFSPHPSR